MIPFAVEELLRWITPLNNMFRTVAHETEIDGIEMNTGDRVALVYPSANRDDDVFTDPDKIELTRDPNPTSPSGSAPTSASARTSLA